MSILTVKSFFGVKWLQISLSTVLLRPPLKVKALVSSLFVQFILSGSLLEIELILRSLLIVALIFHEAPYCFSFKSGFSLWILIKCLVDLSIRIHIFSFFSWTSAIICLKILLPLPVRSLTNDIFFVSLLRAVIPFNSLKLSTWSQTVK